MSLEYAEDKELQQAIDSMVKTCKHFESLRDTGMLVLGVMKVNIDSKGENKRCSGCPVMTKRVGGAERIYIKDHAHFLLMMDYTTWNESNDEHRQFWLHHGLKKIHAERVDGKLKIGLNKPEYTLFYDTIELFGPLSDPLLSLRDVLSRSSRKVLSVVKNLAEKVEAEEKAELEVPEPEPDLPPPRRIKKVSVSGE